MTGQLQWKNSLSSALETARNEKKHVLVDFYGPS